VAEICAIPAIAEILPVMKVSKIQAKKIFLATFLDPIFTTEN
jgi:hypothetical protein